ncbi:hypothetical protein Loa_00949 [Legionella oakridgensis ATCC 33761 = DSM 21215]|uniref:Uncharacterized protein n=2 Tax=Legionella oakridgensis TaxID=29423 RepID=W0B7I3_9GAMM|nr:hypothetical protein Loa_00949 [Legionella oakridgensis ATCC 33761 = DSM 21215]ETO93774.1 hypothetical protein LOR_73c21200 [Legionella oakridgensis RV-2-2007]KTD43925.1 hypothetical protein Loak_0475 [Legionella oakridgensis]STY19670.1 Uncharacterised protein [Legionella longbeachae]
MVRNDDCLMGQALDSSDLFKKRAVKEADCPLNFRSNHHLQFNDALGITALNIELFN